MPFGKSYIGRTDAQNAPVLPFITDVREKKTQTKALFTHSFSLYLIVSHTEIFKSVQFLKVNCAKRCMDLLRITKQLFF